MSLAAFSPHPGSSIEDQTLSHERAYQRLRVLLVSACVVRLAEHIRLRRLSLFRLATVAEHNDALEATASAVVFQIWFRFSYS